MDISKKDLRKENVKSSAHWISNKVKEMDETELISSMFIEANDDVTKEFIKLFETQILLANIDSERFKKGLYLFLKDTAKFIKKNKLQRQLLYFFCYLYKENIIIKETETNPALDSYISLIMEELRFLCNINQTIVGINSKDEFIFAREPLLNIEIPLFTYSKHKDFNKLISDYKKYGYTISDMRDVQALFSNYNAISNNLFQCSFLVNEHNKDMVAKNYYSISKPLNIPNSDNIEEISSYLTKRKRFIKNGRVKVELDAGDIKEVELNEVFIENDLFLYFKAKTQNAKEFNGFIELSNLKFYSIFSELLPGTDKLLCNLIFEIYALITTDILKEETRYDEFKMIFKYKEQNNLKLHSSNKNSLNHINLQNYQEELIDVDYFIRKLPEGAVASDEAKSLAKKYGFELSDNETFVRKFKKTIYKKKQQ